VTGMVKTLFPIPSKKIINDKLIHDSYFIGKKRRKLPVILISVFASLYLSNSNLEFSLFSILLFKKSLVYVIFLLDYLNNIK
jgi:hypothetical protein